MDVFYQTINSWRLLGHSQVMSDGWKPAGNSLFLFGYNLRFLYPDLFMCGHVGVLRLISWLSQWCIPAGFLTTVWNSFRLSAGKFFFFLIVILWWCCYPSTTSTKPCLSFFEINQDSLLCLARHHLVTIIILKGHSCMAGSLPLRACPGSKKTVYLTTIQQYCCIVEGQKLCPATLPKYEVAKYLLWAMTASCNNARVESYKNN